ncbi:hypothetical protein [Ulvibacterium sp.]|uniref:hypothetical protein n=1 Tax=Ulvibacterium sp. TaxID=2665914 RepID=UPI00260EA47E|nr:hypothetical protein [Ulvibacterium sp.]
MKLTKEEHRLLISRIVNDTIIHERMCNGINYMLNSISETEDNEVGPIYFGIDTAIDLMGFMGKRENYEVMKKFYHFFLDQIKMDLDTPVNERKAVIDLASEIVDEWFNIRRTYKAQLN